jgi:hypothetical protein
MPGMQMRPPSAVSQEASMRRILLLAVVLASTSGFAHAEPDQTCLGFANAPKLHILWNRAAIEIDGRYVAMKRTPTIINQRHLVGHGMALQQRGVWVEFNDGGPKTIRYRCYPGLAPGSSRSPDSHKGIRNGGGRG